MPCNLFTWTQSLNGPDSYPMSAFYRPPPTEETGPYEPYVYPVTADKIEAYTLPNVKAIALEALALGKIVMGLD